MASYTDMPGVDPAITDYAAFLEGLSPSELDAFEAEPLLPDYPAGLDGHPTGDAAIGDINGLTRTNYFNGRYLDAEALRRDQVYFARRDRVVAQTEHAGIAWGLGLEYPRSGAHEGDELFTVASQIVLRPGVGFDGEGRPIVVDRPFGFTLDELLTAYARTPSRAVAPRSRFQPCICVERLPGNESVGPEHETGAYLLVISPTARSEGSARVYRDPCAKDRNVDCDADAWRHAFRLSLVRYDVFQHETRQLPDRCALRGLLAAHYFDVWERDLRGRWRPPFAEDHRFCQGLGPFQRAPGAVALAMCFVTTNGDVLVFDPWIPRRYQISSAARAWEAAVRGAPTPAASVARRHQFQCQLSECLEQRTRATIPDLHSLGIRHMAPCGFLPIDLPPGVLDDAEREWRGRGLGRHEAQRIEFVREQAHQYFEGTNVLPRYRVALYEDDIFELMDDVAEKDPIVVRPASTAFFKCLGDFFFSAGYGIYSRLDFMFESEHDFERTTLADVFACLLESEAHTLERVVNRELELVDVIIPLWGRRYMGEPVPIADELRELLDGTGHDPQDFTDIVGDTIAAREFVFFHKRRAVIDDWIYLILDGLFDLMAFYGLWMKDVGGRRTGGVAAETHHYTLRNSVAPGWNRDPRGGFVPTRELVAANDTDLRIAANVPQLHTLLSAAVRRAHPELENRAVIERFDTLADERGRYEAIDIMLEEYPAFADYKLMAALDPQLLETVHDDVRERAGDGEPVAIRAFDPAKVAELEPRKAAIYRAARAAFGSEKIGVGNKEITRNELLRRSERQLKAIDPQAAGLAEATVRDARKLERASLRIASARAAGPRLAEAYEAAVIEHGEEKALEELGKEQGFKTVAEDLRVVREVIGAAGVDRLMNVMREQ